MSGSKGPPPVDRLLAEVRHGVAGTDELKTLGLTQDQIDYRVRVGRLHPLFPTVFAVGRPAVTREGRWRAAVLACGPDAVLSHRDAGALWRIRACNRRLIDVTTPHRGRKGPKGVHLHRVRRLDPADVTVRDGIPVTTLARTLLDLAEVVDAAAVAKAVNEAEVLRLLDTRACEDALGRANGRRRAHVLREVLAEAAEVGISSRELQRRFRRLCHGAGLPMPVEEAEVLGLEVDFLWPEQRLVVETDGAATHLTRKAFERDRARDVDLALAGYLVLRFTHRQVTAAPGDVAAKLRRALSAR